MAKSFGCTNIKKALQIMAAMPVTGCEAERAFAELAPMKTSLQSDMGHEK